MNEREKVLGLLTCGLFNHGESRLIEDLRNLGQARPPGDRVLFDRRGVSHGGGGRFSLPERPHESEEGLGLFLVGAFPGVVAEERLPGMIPAIVPEVGSYVYGQSGSALGVETGLCHDLNPLHNREQRRLVPLCAGIVKPSQTFQRQPDVIQHAIVYSQHIGGHLLGLSQCGDFRHRCQESPLLLFVRDIFVGCFCHLTDPLEEVFDVSDRLLQRTVPGRVIELERVEDL